ncbi:MAG: hypothetical protein M0Z67_02245 [Nitrospiraceae bacterium]|nr:hypothetical protein [Nitrospiraceae bacterium]
MHRNLRIAFGIVVIVTVSAAISALVTWKYLRRDIVVVDLKELVAYEQLKTQKMDREQAVKEVGIFFDTFTKDVQARKELVLLKEAVLNAKQFKDITHEYKR